MSHERRQKIKMHPKKYMLKILDLTNLTLQFENLNTSKLII